MMLCTRKSSLSITCKVAHLRLSITYVYHEFLKWCKTKLESQAVVGEEHLYPTEVKQRMPAGRYQTLPQQMLLQMGQRISTSYTDLKAEVERLND